MNRRWLVRRTNPEFLNYLSAKASISPVLAQILVNRGIRDAESIREFLHPSIENLHDPFLMPDMQKAVDRLKAAVDRGETLFIHGDYDADGVTSTALLVSVFRKLGLKVFYHIPNRITEGYGFGDTGLQKAGDCNASLIITADCGISSADEVLKARSMGMDVIITDHHEPPGRLPEAAAVLNPCRTDSAYPFKHLAGVGVAFKLVQAFFHGLRVAGCGLRAEELLDLVALGTIADSVPLTGENRIFAACGLREINSPGCRTGIRALKEAARIDGREISSGLLSFTLLPRINAAGRLDDAGVAVELFLTEDEPRARDIAALLDEHNRKRQKIEGEVLRAAIDMIDPRNPGNVIVLSSPDWHIGVVGIVASRLVDMFYRPVFLFSVKDSVAKGSARSIPPFHIYKAVSECSGLLLGFGGHRQAAGLSLAAENLPAFRERINSIAENTLRAEDMIPLLEIDAAVSFPDINFSLVKELSLLEPYGNANREPILGAKDIEIVSRRTVGDNHLKMQLKQERTNIDTIGFSMADKLGWTAASSSLDIAFVPCINEWNGTRSIQLNLKAVRPRG
ncbi:MAG: single-stranded-DNA-specific exonuclease RecJ [Deferribacteres bacterium]|nr:single-stranded-DNA-specific exonuclease RecJ [Deferribacteres bacterium]